MDPTRRSTVDLAIVNFLDPKDSDSGTLRLSSRRMEITLPRSKFDRTTSSLPSLPSERLPLAILCCHLETRDGISGCSWGIVFFSVNGESYGRFEIKESFLFQHRFKASSWSEAERRTRMRTLRLSGLRCRTDDLEEPLVAQALLQLRRVPPFVRLDESERRPGRGHLLSRLLQPKFRPEGCGLRHGRGHPDDGLTDQTREPVLYIYTNLNINAKVKLYPDRYAGKRTVTVWC